MLLRGHCGRLSSLRTGLRNFFVAKNFMQPLVAAQDEIGMLQFS
jgi:hypothetical protein